MTGFFSDHLNLDTTVAYVDGELSLVAFQRAAAHVAQCAQCAAEVDEQLCARTSLRSAAAPPMPSSLTEALRAIPLALPAAGRVHGLGTDSRTGQAIRIVHVGRDTRSRRLRLGAGALVAGIAVGAFATSASEEPTPVPGPAPTVLPASSSFAPPVEQLPAPGR